MASWSHDPPDRPAVSPSFLRVLCVLFALELAAGLALWGWLA